MDKKVLVVDDEADVRDSMAEALKEAGFAVFTATNGEEGLAAALTEKPDLILLDLIMPTMDGHKMLEELRSDDWGKTVPVIVLTAMDDVENVALAHEGSITDYIIKVHTSLDDIVNKVRLTIV